MTTGDVVYSLRFSLIKILPEPGFDLGSTAGESCVLTARLHMLYEQLKQFLMDTKDKTLAEANGRDSYFAIGLPLTHPDVLNPTKWADNSNHLGRILMEIREELRSAS